MLIEIRDRIGGGDQRRTSSRIFGGEITENSQNFLRAAFSAAKILFSALRTEMIGGGETQFRPSQSVVWEEGDYGLLALSLMTDPGLKLFWGRKWNSLIKSSFVPV